MTALVKYIVAKTYQPLLVKYLAKTRQYTFQDIHLEIPPQVFHPRFFTSTRFLLNAVLRQNLNGKNVLELGAGSGLISMCAARKGAAVTATDINPIAVHYLKENAKRNKVKMEVIESDLFESIPERSFDIICINPPYYKRNPVTVAEHAWYCGEEGEYFQRLFAKLKSYTHAQTIVLMVLCDGCDIKMVRNFALKNSLHMTVVDTKKTLIETTFLFNIECN